MRIFFTAVVTLSIFSATLLRADDPTPPAIHVAHAGLSKLAWQLAIPTGTFTDRSVFETIDLLHSLNIHHLELTPGQILQPGSSAMQVSAAMPADATAALMAKLKSVHMDIVSYGPVDLGPDDTSARQVFEFAKKIKAKDIVAAPSADALERMDKLATEFGINLAIENQTDLPAYRLPADLLKATALRSTHIGSDDDLTQWQKTAVDPVAATRQLRGHIVQIRVGDADAPGAERTESVLAELKEQGFKGVITVACIPGNGADEINKFVAAVNALSDAVTHVAGN
jgi:sugar phosphate isomerase/epimerase